MRAPRGNDAVDEAAQQVMRACRPDRHRSSCRGMVRGTDGRRRRVRRLRRRTAYLRAAALDSGIPHRSPRTDRPCRGSAPSLLRDPDFLKLWTGQTISAFGTQVTILAVPIVAALTLKVSPFEFGLLGDARVPAVRPHRPAGRRLGRSPPTAPDPHLGRPRTRDRPAVDPARLRPRRADDLAALRRRARQRLPDRLLRRRLPELPALDRRARPARRRRTRSSS